MHIPVQIKHPVDLMQNPNYQVAESPISKIFPEPDCGKQHRDVVLLPAEHVEPVGRRVLCEGRQEVRVL